MIEITLTEFDKKLAWGITLKREKENSGNKVKEKIQDSKRKPLENAYLGTLGELAWAKHFNLYLDLTWGSRSGKSKFGAVDVISREGDTIDIKTTDHENGNLAIFGEKTPENVDKFGLVRTRDYSTFYLLGTIDSNLAIDVKYLTPGANGGKPYYLVPSKDLEQVN